MGAASADAITEPSGDKDDKIPTLKRRSEKDI
jgi:hypothetical protein